MFSYRDRICDTSRVQPKNADKLGNLHGSIKNRIASFDIGSRGTIVSIHAIGTPPGSTVSSVSVTRCVPFRGYF